MSSEIVKCIIVLGACAVSGIISAADKRPNVVMIVGDDIGFSDIGCFGSEIQTPNLDKLAKSGIRFTQFNNMSKCNPTRSSIMTGLYTGGDNAVGFPQILRDSGYHTMFAGKQHLDPWVPERVRANKSFDRWFESPFSAFMIKKDGGFPQYNRGDQRAIFDLDGKEMDVTELETSKPFHKTDATTDYALRFLDDSKSKDKPFFMYLAYHAAHFPLHATQEDIAKYRDVYRQGWDKIRADRFRKQQEIGVVDKSVRLSEPTDNINATRQPPFPGPFKGNDQMDKRMKTAYHRPWNILSPEEQDELSLEMAVFAAMVDRMDQNIGRVIAKLEKMGVRDNSLIMFYSDNGSCPFDFNRSYAYPPGVPEGYRSLSAPWANVGNTPFKYFKQFGHQGGMNTHFIANWPAEIPAGKISKKLSHVVDLAPTLIELASTKYPEEVDGVKTPRLPGVSLVKDLKGGTTPERDYLFGGYTGFNSYRKGDWKIVQVNSELDHWELYNMKNDPTEITNLASSKPEIVKELLSSLQICTDL